MAKKKEVKKVVHVFVRFADGPFAFCSDTLKKEDSDVLVGHDGEEEKLLAAEGDGSVCPACVHVAKWHSIGFENGKDALKHTILDELLSHAKREVAEDEHPEVNTRAKSNKYH